MGFQFVSISELSKEQIQVLKDSVAKETTDTELTYFLNVALAQNLDPFRKEVWSIKYGGKLTVQTGRDGFLKIAKRDPMFDYIQSCEVREGDDFRMDPISGQVEHRLTAKRGQILGAYAIITRKDSVKLTKYVTFSEYNDGSSSMWRDYPTAMITKCVESVLCKQFANVTGIVAEETMRKDGTVIDSSPNAQAQASTLADDLVKKIDACTTPAEFAKVREEVAGVAGKLFGDEKEKVFAAAKRKKAEMEPFGTLPPDLSAKVIDHKDGDPTNNDISNLDVDGAPPVQTSILPQESPSIATTTTQDDPEMDVEEFSTWVMGLRNQESVQGVEDCFIAAMEKPLSQLQRTQLEEIRQACKKELEPKRTKKKAA
jgi:recombinational DNA repair protein RecT